VDVLQVRITIPSANERKLFEALAVDLGIRPDMLRPISGEIRVLRGDLDDAMVQGLLKGGYPARLVEVISRSKDPRDYIAMRNPYQDRLEEHYSRRERLKRLTKKGG